ncbi:hypothetical protein D039_4478B, partial [Vibrio parahaemolyticus EKP-028]
EYR